ncbi:MAG TPA: DUF4080 domain-containing protein, partial [Negativicutes bacterium]
MKTVLTTLNAKYIHSSLALRCLAVYCRPVCPDIVIKEYSINNGVLAILSDIYQEKPDVLGLACYIWNIEMTLILIGLLKKVLPDVLIVLGGPEVSYDPAQIMRCHDNVDYIVQGEGEEILHKLLTHLLSGDARKSLSIPGLAFRQNDQIVVGDGPQVVADLDVIPFHYCDTDMIDLKDKIIYYESSRGCPFSCQYCLSSITCGVRFFKPERVIQDLQFFIRHDVKQVKFVDRTFNARKEHYLPLLQFLARQNCRTNFHFEMAADLLDEETICFLQDVPPGRFQLEIGIQSTHQPTLLEIRRYNQWHKIADSVSRILSYNNMHVHLDLIVGLPQEDYTKFGQSFNAVYELQPDMLQIGFLKLLKGSGIRERAADHEYVYMNIAPYEVLANQDLPYEDVRRLKIFEEMFNQVYNSGRFRQALSFIIQITGGNAFAFYHKLVTYWEERQYHVVAHTSKAVYRYLLDFCLVQYPCVVEEFQEFLKWGALVSEKGAVQPEFLPWNQEKWADEKTQFWRNASLVRRYLPDYKFTTWREIKKNHHIEVFAIDIPNYLSQAGVINKQYTPVLFSYDQDSVVFQ